MLYVILNANTGSYYKTIKANSFNQVYDVLLSENRFPEDFTIMTSISYYDTFRTINNIINNRKF